MLGVEDKFEGAILSMVGGIIWSSWGFLRWNVKEERKEAKGGKPLSVIYGPFTVCPVFCSCSPAPVSTLVNGFVERDKEASSLAR